MEEKKVKQWVCLLCGYVYPEAELPEDYVCPICGAPADQFEPVEE